VFALRVETIAFKGPSWYRQCSYDSSTLPLVSKSRKIAYDERSGRHPGDAHRLVLLGLAVSRTYGIRSRQKQRSTPLAHRRLASGVTMGIRSSIALRAPNSLLIRVHATECYGQVSEAL
jgi:hypothetical protein